MAKSTGKKSVGTKKSLARKSGAEKAPAGKAARAKGTSPNGGKPVEAKVTEAELDALRRPIEAAKGDLAKAQAEAKVLAEKVRRAVAEAALAPYREACCKVGVECEYEGGRSANLSEKVSFLVQKTEKGVRVMVKGRPNTEEVIPLAILNESINKAAYAYTDKHLGLKERVGNKGGSLSNRLRAVLA
jgi:hypothetical protein